MYTKIHNLVFRLRNFFQLLNLKLLGANIGSSVKSFGRITVINAKNLVLGDDVTLNEGVHINCRGKVSIGHSVRISTQVQMHTGKLIANEHDRYHLSGNIVIEDNVWIASSCVISEGVKIGKNSIIAAGSVVINDIPPNCIAAGIPAKVIKKLTL